MQKEKESKRFKEWIKTIERTRLEMILYVLYKRNESIVCDGIETVKMFHEFVSDRPHKKFNSKKEKKLYKHSSEYPRIPNLEHASDGCQALVNGNKQCRNKRKQYILVQDQKLCASHYDILNDKGELETVNRLLKSSNK
jgi:hypothetical protein